MDYLAEFTHLMGCGNTARAPATEDVSPPSENGATDQKDNSDALRPQAASAPVMIQSETVRAEVVLELVPGQPANGNVSKDGKAGAAPAIISEFLDFAVSAMPSSTMAFAPVCVSSAVVDSIRTLGRRAVCMHGASASQSMMWMADLATSGALSAPIGLVVADLTGHADAAAIAGVIRDGAAPLVDGTSLLAFLVVDADVAAVIRRIGAQARVMPIADGRAMGVFIDIVGNDCGPGGGGGDRTEATPPGADEHLQTAPAADAEIGSHVASDMAAEDSTLQVEAIAPTEIDPDREMAQAVPVDGASVDENAHALPDIAAAVQELKAAEVGPSIKILRTNAPPLILPGNRIVPSPGNDNRREDVISLLDAKLLAMGLNRSARRRLKAITLCSGIEAQAEALRRIGAPIDVVAMSEIGEVQSAILAARHPNAINLGDLTALDFCPRALEASPAGYDLLIASTPCQPFSLAGQRHGVADPRGALTALVIDILNELKISLYMWENVIGALSDKTNAFGIKLAALLGLDEALVPPKGRWPNFGAATGPLRSVAWRVLDAQHWGVPQRRRRIFLVAVTHESGLDPREIIFEAA